jgi:regulator of protease activity HflC (stomatin/prohibitin superfamily)
MQNYFQLVLDNMALAIFVIIAAGAIISSVHNVHAGERGVLFRHGKFVKIIEPGLCMIIPMTDILMKVNIAAKIPGCEGFSEEQIREKLESLILSDPEIFNR